MDSRYNKYLRLAENTYFKRLGKVVKIVGLTIESVGPDAKLMTCAELSLMKMLTPW